jgi:hypothetical protein
MRTLPKPLPDELLYSTFARAAYRYGFWSPKRLLDVLFRRRTVVAVADLPSNLAAVAEVTSAHWQLGPEALAMQHTLLGYYVHYQTHARRRRVLQAMVGEGGHLHVGLGVCAGAAIVPTMFRLCPQCHAADVAQYGEPYWHRVHHLPGVVLCPHHAAPLLQTAVPFRPTGRHAYMAAPSVVDIAGLVPLVHELACPAAALAVAVQANAVMVSAEPTDGALPDYRPELQGCGFGVGEFGLKRLRAAFVDHCGMDFLQASLRQGPGDMMAWLGEVLRRPRRRMHPHKHVLMRVFIDAHQAAQPEVGRTPLSERNKSWGLYREPGLRREAESLRPFGYSTHAIAKTLGVDWKTASRLLAPLPPPSPTRRTGARPTDRMEWELVAAKHPVLGKKALRALIPATYARLYRHDCAWLIGWQREIRLPPRVARRVDWPARDAELQERVRQQVEATLQNEPQRRASRNHVLGVLRLRSMLRHRAELLPQTVATLDAMCETVHDHQLRRLTDVLRRPGAASALDWRVLREAGINPDRFADGAQGLLRAARLRLADAP